MEDILAIIIQFLAEFLLEVLANAGLWPFPSKQPEGRVDSEAALLWLLLGGLMGWVLSLIFPMPFIRSEVLRIVNLVISPLLSGVLGYHIAQWRMPYNANVVPRKHFWYAFWFASGLVLMRFAYATTSA